MSHPRRRLVCERLRKTAKEDRGKTAHFRSDVANLNMYNWVDNNIVSIMSTFHPKPDGIKLTAYRQRGGESVQVPRDAPFGPIGSVSITGTLTEWITGTRTGLIYQ